MRTIGIAERRARFGRRHRLARAVPDVTALAGDLVGLHSSDPSSVFLAARARVEGFAASKLETALYDDRTLARMLGMRRTMFVVPRDLAAVMNAACTQAFIPAERRRMAKILEDQGVADDGAAWLADVTERTLVALREAGEATANELGEQVPELRQKLTFGEGKSWGGTFGMSTRVLFLLATEGRIVRGRPLGTWLSSQYRWAPTAAWLGAELEAMDPPAARIELTERWLRAFGPGTLDDLKWWTGWGVRQARAAIDAVGAVEVDLGHSSGFVLADDVDPVDPPEPWVALLPSLDSTTMGWKRREWYVGDHRSALFDRNGNAGPTIWCDGRIIGGWSQRPDGEVVVRVLEDVGSAATAAVDHAAAELAAWLGEVRITPRFRTPLEKALAT
jgi:hypothetical protein